jgi:DNA-directed RNA polymerase beta subunit
MFKPVQVGKRTRYTYAKINEVLKMPHLLDLQIKSYEWFLEKGLKGYIQGYLAHPGCMRVICLCPSRISNWGKNGRMTRRRSS